MLCKTTVALLGSALFLVACTDDSAHVSGKFKLSSWNISVFHSLSSLHLFVKKKNKYLKAERQEEKRHLNLLSQWQTAHAHIYSLCLILSS